MLFFRSQCPGGWVQAPSTQGRFLVGVPDGAPPNVGFGGAPLASDEQRAHRHAAEGSIDVGNHGIALASGCCGGGYAAAGAGLADVAAGQDPAARPGLARERPG